MPELSDSVWLYFTPAHETFWKWSADQQAVEWMGGQTIAFRFELQTLMEHLVEEGLPPFENILLTVAACRNRSESALRELPNLLRFSGYPMRYSMVETVAKVVERLEMLARLPEEVRTSNDGKKAILALISENGPFRKKPDFSRDSIEWLAQGYNIVPGAHSFLKTTSDWITELRGLHDGLAAINEVAVRLRMQTGFEALPSPIPLNLPAPPPLPEPVPLTIRELLRELEQDEEHAGLVRLTRRLLAVVSLPRPISSPDDQPLGGVSDITNRGPFDRLLLSELAQDSDVLMTRVALNEAMYIRREVPPAFPPRDRLVLVDAGIRMWGLPRLYATAAALALAVMQDDAAQTRLFRPTSDGVLPIDLTDRDELIDHLSRLELAVHPGAALEAFVAQAEGLPAEFVIVTGEDVLCDPEFRQCLTNQRMANLYVIAVTREGDLRLLQRTRQGERVLRQAKLDLNQILAGPPRSRPKLRNGSIDPRLPAICRMQPFPLYLTHQIDWDSCGVVHPLQSANLQRADHLLSVTHDRRLMLWLYDGFGPLQLSDQLPAGKLLWHTSQFDIHEPTKEWQLVMGIVEQGYLSVVTVRDQETKVVRLDLPQKPVDGFCEHAGILYVVQQREITLFARDTGSKLGTMALPSAMIWLSERFAKSNQGYHVLTYDGRQPEWQLILRQDPKDYLLISTIIDCESQGAIVGFFKGNYVQVLGAEKRLTFRSQYVRPSSEIVSEDQIGARDKPNRWYNISKVSADGSRFVLSDQSDRTEIRYGWLVDLSQMTAVQKWGEPARILNSTTVRLPTQKGLRNRLQHITTFQEHLVLVTSKGRCLELLLQENPERLVLKDLPISQKELDHSTEFGPTRNPEGVGYELRSATWPDGSRAYLDSRGMLHLQSSDPQIPELTLVLYDENVAGWCDRNLVWGDVSFAGPLNPRTHVPPSHVLHRWLVHFCRRLR